MYIEEWTDFSTISLNDALFLYAHDPEDRSNYCADNLRPSNPRAHFLDIEVDADDAMSVKGATDKISLSSTAQISEFYKKYNTSVLYLDVTGMSCRLVAPLLKSAIQNNIDVRVVYTEPADYKLPEFQNEGVHNDLSECVNGVLALPGFAKVFRRCKEEPLFVALLGFEGGRFTHLVTTQQPSSEKICPVVGVPGYRMEYPFASFWGNRFSLRLTKAWERVEYAEANSIADAYFVLDKIWKANHRPYMLIAPIGTKPHAIGSILYAIKNDTRVELLYDNPRRSKHRTEGIGRIQVCNVTKLFNEN